MERCRWSEINHLNNHYTVILIIGDDLNPDDETIKDVGIVKSAEIINTLHQSKELHKAFPKGHKVSTDSGLVLIVGPNGSGKTGFLRMVYTANDFKRYFDRNGVSKWWKFYGLDAMSKKIDDNVKNYRIDEKYKTGSGGKYNRIQFKGIETLKNEPRFGKIDFDKIFDIDGAREVLSQAREVLSEDTDINHCGYAKLDISDGGPVYNDIILTSWGNQIHGTRLSESGRMNGINYGDFSPNDARVGFSKSNGIYAKRTLKEGFERVDAFFDERKIPIFYTLEPFLGYCRVDEDGEFIQKDDPKAMGLNVPEDARMTLFFDEPTVFLDYDNLYWFRDKIAKTLDKYGKNLQIFISTNDPILIEKTNGYGSINLYNRPATSGGKFVHGRG